MAAELSSYRGCLWGLAAGDAMGLRVDKKPYEDICQDYGPNGILGYDLANGCAEVSSYTQIAAFSCNALLLGITRGKLQSGSIPYHKYMALGMREWSQTQRFARFPNKMYCWVCHIEELRQRKCLDSRTLDTLAREAFGTISQPANRNDTPGALTAAVAAGLFFYPERMKIHEVGLLGAQAVALTHGDPGTFLSGAIIAYTVAGILNDRELPLQEHFSNAAQAVVIQFGKIFPAAQQLQAMVNKVIALTQSGRDPHETIMSLQCDTAPRVLAGAMYTCLTCGEDFDTAMVTAVNHSGRSSAVASLAGAFLGAKLGHRAIPGFYLDCLEPAAVLDVLAKDLVQACPGKIASRLFDDDWDRKYIQGEPVASHGWEEA